MIHFDCDYMAGAHPEVLDATFEYWGPRGEEESKVRFVTSWETTDEQIAALEALL